MVGFADLFTDYFVEPFGLGFGEQVSRSDLQTALERIGVVFDPVDAVSTARVA